MVLALRLELVVLNCDIHKQNLKNLKVNLQCLNFFLRLNLCFISEISIQKLKELPLSIGLVQ